MERTPALAMIAAVLWVASAGAPPGAGAATRTITYSTDKVGAGGPDLAGFRRIVGATLDDPRGWSLGGSVNFREVEDGGRLTISLAGPAAIEALGACSAYYSCRVDDHVLINSDRWREATDSYPGEALLHSYRQMVINHEVGHALGFGHADCARPGAPAAVMQQQSKGLGGCERNPWPSRRELAQHAARVGVRLPAARAPFAPGERSSHVELGERRSSVLATLGRPQRRLQGRMRADVYVRPQVAVAYAAGRVTSITTRSPADVGTGGLGVGRRPAREVLRRCASRPIDGRCSLVTGRRGSRRTTLIIRDGRIAAMRIDFGGARRASSRSGALSPPRPVAGALLTPLTTASAAGPCAWWWARAGRCRATSS